MAMTHRDHLICQIIAKHESGIDIESIARGLRVSKEEISDVHTVGNIVGSYVNNKAILTLGARKK